MYAHGHAKPHVNHTRLGTVSAGVPKSHIAQQLHKNRETFHLWLKGIAAYGLLPFLERYQQAPKQPGPKRQVDALVKRGLPPSPTKATHYDTSNYVKSTFEVIIALRMATVIHAL